jgi:hypothetical protein
MSDECFRVIWYYGILKGLKKKVKSEKAKSKKQDIQTGSAPYPALT